jgi:hypothetical protein
MKRTLGATTVEFALVLIFFLTFLLGILDFARMLWTWHAATEATRWGARVAVVCNVDAGVVLADMQKFLPQLTDANVKVTWYDANGAPNACDSSNCVGVNVSIKALDYTWLSPVGYATQAAFGMPAFSTYLPREIMGQDLNSSSVCS